MENNAQPTIPAEHLLVEGARSYREALIAIDSFRRIVYSRCREVILKNIDGLNNAIGEIHGEDDMNFHQKDEGLGDSEGNGLTFFMQGPKLAAAKMCFFVGLWWGLDDRGTSQFWVYSGFWAPRKLRDRMNSLIEEQKHDYPGLEIWRTEGIYIAQILAPDEAVRFTDTLNTLIMIWISIGEKLGSYLSFLNALNQRNSAEEANEGAVKRSPI